MWRPFSLLFLLTLLFSTSNSPIAAASYWNYPGGIVSIYDSSRSLLLGGTDECATTADNAAFTNNTFTISIDVKANAQAGGKVLFSQYDYAGAGNMSWSLWAVGVTQTIEFIVSDDGSYGALHTKEYISSVNFLDGSWHTIKGVFAAGTMKLFKDGVEDTLVTKALDAAITTVFNSTARVGVGCDYNGVNRADFFVGRLDRAFYSSADLSAVSTGTGAAKIDLSGVTGAKSLWDVKSTDSNTAIADQVSGRTLDGHNLESGDIDTDI